jgi:aminoglycoside 6'-N-acetyltransferase
MNGQRPVMEWTDGERSTVSLGDDRFSICVGDRRIGEIVVYASFPGAWQRIHGYGDDEKLWSFDEDIAEPSDRGKGYGSRAVRHTCEAVLRCRHATRVVVDVRAGNRRAIAAYEKAGFHKVRFLPNHNDGHGDATDAYLMEFRP